MVRVIFLVFSIAVLGAGYYLSVNNVGQESRDLDRSVRIGGVGGGVIGRVK